MTLLCCPRSQQTSIVGVCLLLGVLAAGCEQRKAVVKAKQITLTPTRSETSPFEVAVRFLNSLDQYQPAQVRPQILNNLREWARQERDLAVWIADPMFRRLPSEFKESYTVERLATNEFEQHDVYVLQEAIWLRDVAKNVASQPLYELHMQKWLEDEVTSGHLGPNQADDISLAYRLFDWSVRNIQLDPEFEDRDILGGEQERERRDANTLRHLYYPWENLLYGHGDWLERSRVFMLLARQLGIHVVMLVANRGDDEPAQPWVTAALIGDRLYLFDAELGLPLPGADGAVIGRLAAYAERPELLEQLSVEGLRYRIGKSDLENIVAAIDATPAALSQRMKQVESRLNGEQKMVLTVAPTPLARELRNNKYVTNVEIWTLPYRGYEFFRRLRVDPNQALSLLTEMQLEQRPFESRGSIMQGRLLHLRGQYRGDPDAPGATKHYMDSRVADKELEKFNIPLSQVPPSSPLLSNLPVDPVQRQLVFDQRMRMARELAVWSKDLATYWLGMIAFEKHEFKVASDYLNRVVSKEPVSRWRQSANYNLARAYEAIGALDNEPGNKLRAINLYAGDTETPQRAGNLIRARQLAERP